MQPLPKPPVTKHAGLICLGVLALAALFYGLPKLDEVNRAERSAAAAAHWGMAPATFLRTEHIARRRSGSYEEVWYAYDFAGKRYESNRENFVTGSRATSQDSFDIQRRAAAGTLTVYVDPADPSRAVVRRVYYSAEQIQRLRRFSGGLLSFAGVSLVVIAWRLLRPSVPKSA